MKAINYRNILFAIEEHPGLGRVSWYGEVKNHFTGQGVLRLSAANGPLQQSRVHIPWLAAVLKTYSSIAIVGEKTDISFDVGLRSAYAAV